ncbi:hypothetical protein BC567DRAFT_26853 [Phyllosticta citribraziliensis]
MHECSLDLDDSRRAHHPFFRHLENLLSALGLTRTQRTSMIPGQSRLKPFCDLFTRNDKSGDIPGQIKPQGSTKPTPSGTCKIARHYVAKQAASQTIQIPAPRNLISATVTQQRQRVCRVIDCIPNRRGRADATSQAIGETTWIALAAAMDAEQLARSMARLGRAAGRAE